jgi:glycosyltransferase involved in cell wall biosynthesis
MKRLRVLQVINSLEIGGAETLLKNFTLSVSSLLSIEVCTLYRGGSLMESLQNAKIPVYCLNLRCKYDPTKVAKLCRLIQEKNYDIVHAHLFPAGLLTAVVSRLVQAPRYLFSEHGVWNRRRAFAPWRWVDRWWYMRYAAIVCVSQQVKDSLLDWLPQLESRVLVVPSGVPIFSNGVDIQPRWDLIFVGRLEHVKGVDTLLQSLILLREEGWQPSVLIVGDGSQAQRLEKLCRRWGLESQVVWIGARTDVDNLLRAARIFVLPSRAEGLPMALLEAMAAGKPIIATAVGGVPEALEHGKEALLVPPENPRALMGAIKMLLSNPEQAQHLGEAARQKARERFSIERWVQDMLSVYEAVSR